MASETRNRGFASMNSEKQKEIARKGGRAAHEKGTAHEFTTDEARAAGRKGGERVSANRSHMAEIGRMGGKSSAGRRAQIRQERSNPDVSGGSQPNRSHATASRSSELSQSDEPSRMNESMEAVSPNETNVEKHPAV